VLAPAHRAKAERIEATIALIQSNPRGRRSSTRDPNMGNKLSLSVHALKEAGDIGRGALPEPLGGARSIAQEPRQPMAGKAGQAAP
jgi:hypothetical protein